MTAQPNITPLFTPAGEPLVYTVQEIADLLEIGKTKAYELVNTPAKLGGIPSKRLGPKTIRVRRVDFERWLEEQQG